MKARAMLLLFYVLHFKEKVELMITRNTSFCITGLMIIGLLSCETIPTRPDARKIRQSFKIHDDNVNGFEARINNISIREVTNFYYNPDGTLDSLEVFSDSTQTHLKKSMKLQYLSGKVRGFLFEDSTGHFALDFYYGANKEFTKMTDTLGLGLGLFFTYADNKITHMDAILPGNMSSLTDFVYDVNNDLVQYIIRDNTGNPFIKVIYEFDYTHPVPENLDIRFASGGIRFLYSGGVNVLALMGINDGVGNKLRIVKRTEILISTGQVQNAYEFNYTSNANDEITNRKVNLNDSINVYYEYKY